MKKVLITGANSYIGTSFEKFINQNHEDEIEIATLDMMNPRWKEFDFSKFDVVFHVAGIAHRKETKENANLYYTVNRDLAVEVAKVSKDKGIKQFIFMSSMSVYGLDYSNELITKTTKTNPKTNYGKSKLEAEREILKLKDDTFKVSILRPPMVYGKNSPGNMTKLVKAVRKFRMFPTIKNQRSSITIENLSKFVFEVINNEQDGLFLPQNKKYMCTYETIKEQMKEEKINVLYISIFNPLLKVLIGKIGVITKAFGDLKYEK